MTENIDFTRINQIMYDQWSKTYDIQPNSTIYCDEQHFPKHWSFLPPSKVVEIGCGTGRHTQKLVGLGHDVTALDISEKMLSYAQNKIAQNKLISENINNAKFIHADFLEYDFSNEKFDFAIMSLVLEHLPDKAAVFAKIKGLLKNGGKFFLSEIHHSRMENGSGARFTNADGAEIRAASFMHNRHGVITAAKDVGLGLLSNEIIYGTKHLASLHDGWAKYIDRPMVEIFAFVLE